MVGYGNCSVEREYRQQSLPPSENQIDSFESAESTGVMIDAMIQLKNWRSTLDTVTPCLVLWLIFTFYYLWWASFVTMSEHPDEIHHLTYITDVLNGRWIPDYTTGASHSYLEHPALYYTLMGKFAALMSVLGVGVSTSLHMANYTLGLLTIFALYGFSRLVAENVMAAVIATICAISIPYDIYLFTGINNDNLATPLVIITAYLSCRFYQLRDNRFLGRAIATVLVIALVKSTALIQAGAFVLPAAFLLLKDKGTSAIVDVLKMRSVIAGLIAVIGYYATIILIYGELFPAPIDYFELARTISPDNFTAERMPLLNYLAKFLSDMLVQASGVYSHTVYRSTTSFTSFWPLAYIAGFFCVAVSARFKPFRLISLSLFLAIGLFAVLHVWIMYGAHLKYGYLGGLQFRYYLPVLTLFIAASVGFVSRLPLHRIAAASLLIFILFGFVSHDARSDTKVNQRKVQRATETRVEQ